MKEKLICIECNNEYEYCREEDKNTTRKFCAECYRRGRNQKVKQQLLEYLGGKCVKCGYDKCISALHFHHKDRKSKEFVIGSNQSRRFIKVRTELDKCEILCSNCHSEEHFKEVKNKDLIVICSRRLSRIPPKKELEKLLWEKASTQIARQFGVSAKAIEKWAKKYGLSKPPRGYWRKLETGKLPHPVDSGDESSKLV